MRDVAPLSPARNPSLCSPSAPPSAGGEPRETLTTDLRELADAVGGVFPDIARRMRERATLLEAGATLAELAAAGDKSAAFVLDHVTPEEASR